MVINGRLETYQLWTRQVFFQNWRLLSTINIYEMKSVHTTTTINY